MKQNPVVVGLAELLITALTCEPAAAWSHANRWGGDTSHEEGSGSTTRTTGWGGSATHTYGQGTTATGRYGDTATHTEGSGQTTVTNPYGGSATHTYGQGTTYTSGVGKVVKLGRLPVKLQLSLQYMPVRPQTSGQEWNVQVQVTPVIPRLIKGTLFE